MTFEYQTRASLLIVPSVTLGNMWLLSTGHRPHSDPLLEKLHGGGGGAESLGSGSCCSTPPGSSCYSSQRSSPAPTSTTNYPDSPLRPSITRSLSHLLLEEDEEEPETNVDTGVPISLSYSDTAVKTIVRSSSMDCSVYFRSERPAAVGASAGESLAKELIECLPQTLLHPQSTSRTWGPGGRTDSARMGCGSRTVAAGQSPSKGLVVEKRTTAELLSALTNNEEPADEFFI